MENLSVIFPVYNERSSLEIVLKEWTDELNKIKQLEYRFIICEDGSNDGTKELLKKIKNKYRLILNQKNKRRGYGTAIIDGIKTAKSQYVLCIDSDGQCDPKDFRKFWMNRKKATILIGWRKKRADSVLRKMFSSFFKIVFSLLFSNHIHDPSAPFILFKKKNIIPYIKYLRFLREGFWWGFVGACFKLRLSIYEIPINHRRRFQGNTQVYHLAKIPKIALTNVFGLIKLKRIIVDKATN